MAERPARQERGEKVGGRPPAPPKPEPKPSEPYHFTDPQSRIMQAGSGEPFEPAYPAQAAVGVDRRRIVGERVSSFAQRQTRTGADGVGALRPAEPSSARGGSGKETGTGAAAGGREGE